LINAESLKKLKRGAMIINVSRGGESGGEKEREREAFLVSFASSNSPHLLLLPLLLLLLLLLFQSLNPLSHIGLIDTSAVLDAIDSGVIGALALDVYEDEASLFFEDLSEVPFEQRRHLVDRRFQLLMSYPNVLVTPHGAFFFFEVGRMRRRRRGDEERERKKSSLSFTHTQKKQKHPKSASIVAFATTEALEEIARTVEANISA